MFGTATGEPGSAGWWLARQHTPVHRRRSTLSTERIVDAALDLLGREGPDALTTRRVARELGCGQASLYRHVASREELVVLMADRALVVDADSPPTGADWREDLAQSARSQRRHLIAHPELVPLLAAPELFGPGALAGRERALGALGAAGFPADLAVTVYSVVATLVFGSVHHVTGMAPATPQEQEVRRWLFTGQDPGTYPHLVRHAEVLAATTSDEVFEAGLAVVLDGFAAQLARYAV